MGAKAIPMNPELARKLEKRTACSRKKFEKLLVEWERQNEIAAAPVPACRYERELLSFGIYLTDEQLTRYREAIARGAHLPKPDEEQNGFI
jgi:hypothetical protein